VEFRAIGAPAFPKDPAAAQSGLMT